MTTRREFLQAVTAGAVVAFDPLARRIRAQSRSAGWDEVPRILARIKPPVFPARDFDVTRFGAVGDGAKDNTGAFRAAIAACRRAGGGRVVVPSGIFMTGAIELEDHVNLHVSENATVRFTRDTQHYPTVLTRWEGMELMNFSPFIYAFQRENIAITGAGTIDGNANCDHWWPWKGQTKCGWKQGDANQDADRNALMAMVERGVPVADRKFGAGHYLRPQFIQPYRCTNVLIEGVRLLNAPMWQVHPVLCRNVTIRNLFVKADGPNTDGCNPESSTDVLISNCDFDTGDDCIAIKSGRNADGRRVRAPSENIVIERCRMKNGHGGITIGSEISGGVRNVFARDCQLDSPELEFAVRVKNNATRGGVVENVFARDLRIGQVSKAVLTIDFHYEEGEKGGFTPVVRNTVLENITANQAEYALYLRGFANAPIHDVTLADCTFSGVAKPDVVEHVEGLSMRNVRVNGVLVAGTRGLGD